MNPSSFDTYLAAAEAAYDKRPLSPNEKKLQGLLGSSWQRPKPELGHPPLSSMHQWLKKEITPETGVIELFPGTGLMTIPLLIDRTIGNLRLVDQPGVWLSSVREALTALGLLSDVELIERDINARTPPKELQELCTGREVVLSQCNLHTDEAELANITGGMNLNTLLQMIEGSVKTVWVLNAVGREGVRRHHTALFSSLSVGWTLEKFTSGAEDRVKYFGAKITTL